jgi:hypothetical protein
VLGLHGEPGAWKRFSDTGYNFTSKAGFRYDRRAEYAIGIHQLVGKRIGGVGRNWTRYMKPLWIFHWDCRLRNQAPAIPSLSIAVDEAGGRFRDHFLDAMMPTLGWGALPRWNTRTSGPLAGADDYPQATRFGGAVASATETDNTDVADVIEQSEECS